MRGHVRFHGRDHAEEHELDANLQKSIAVTGRRCIFSLQALASRQSLAFLPFFLALNDHAIESAVSSSSCTNPEDKAVVLTPKPCSFRSGLSPLIPSSTRSMAAISVLRLQTDPTPTHAPMPKRLP